MTDSIRNQHLQQRSRVIEQLSNMSIKQIAKELIEERDLKNQAYYFILSQGHLEAFKKYCQTVKNKS